MTSGIDFAHFCNIYWLHRLDIISPDVNVRTGTHLWRNSGKEKCSKTKWKVLVIKFVLHRWIRFDLFEILISICALLQLDASIKNYVANKKYVQHLLVSDIEFRNFLERVSFWDIFVPKFTLTICILFFEKWYFIRLSSYTQLWTFHNIFVKIPTVLVPKNVKASSFFVHIVLDAFFFYFY